jgi:hypothetical protein
MAALKESEPDFEWNFMGSVFPTATINFGPRSVCFDHLDYSNYAPGWCPITSLGPFDPKKGGHLVLFDIGRAIEFPPGSLILIPSALMRHGNTPIQEGEMRMGFTQYAPGAIFRYVEGGCQRMNKMDNATKARMDAAAPGRFEAMLGLYSKVDELEKDREHVHESMRS